MLLLLLRRRRRRTRKRRRRRRRRKRRRFNTYGNKSFVVRPIFPLPHTLLGRTHQ